MYNRSNARGLKQPNEAWRCWRLSQLNEPETITSCQLTWGVAISSQHNGTYINSMRLKSYRNYRLADGDSLGLGELRLVVQFEEMYG